MHTYDVIIAGGGIIGGSIGFELAQQKLRVLLLDRQATAHEASWAAAGMLAPSPETPDAFPLVPLAKASLELYGDFVTAVEDASGRNTGYRREGSVQAFFAANAERELSTFIAVNHGVGISAEAVRVGEARAIEPALNPAAHAAAWLPDEGWVDNRALTRAVLTAAIAGGVEIRTGAGVNSIVVENGRCTGVMARGQKLTANCVVIAAGCFSGGIQGVEHYAPTRPVRGQMMVLRHDKVKIDHVLRSERGYLVPRDDGRILAGSTMEHAGFEKRITPTGVQQILKAAVELAPALADAAIIDAWSGLRPDTQDHLPSLGATDMEGLLMATGHYRNGILLAPITAKIIREWVTERRTSVPLDAFSPLRFPKPAAVRM